MYRFAPDQFSTSRGFSLQWWLRCQCSSPGSWLEISERLGPLFRILYHTKQYFVPDVIVCMYLKHKLFILELFCNLMDLMNFTYPRGMAEHMPHAERIMNTMIRSQRYDQTGLFSHAAYDRDCVLNCVQILF